MPIYNLLEYSKIYAKISASLWQYCGDEPDDNIADSKSFKSKSSITDNTINAGIANLKILEMPLINCEITLDLDWSENCAICEQIEQQHFQ